MKYQLSNYILNIKCNDNALNDIFGVISIGGEGSATDSISVSHSDTLFTTTGYATGGWVHDKNLSKVGTAEITLNQLSAAVARFIQLCNLYFGSDYDGLTISVTDIEGREVATCIDCYPTKIPTQQFGKTATDQTWSFTCGKITFR